MCLSIQPGVAFAVIVRCRAKRLKIEQALVHEKRGGDVGDRRRDTVGAAGRMCLPLAEERLHVLSLQIFLSSAQIAGDDRKSPEFRVSGQVYLLYKDERSDDKMPAIF